MVQVFNKKSHGRFKNGTFCNGVADLMKHDEMLL